MSRSLLTPILVKNNLQEGVRNIQRSQNTDFQRRWLPWRDFLQDIWSTHHVFDSSCIKVLADPSFSQLQPLKWCQELPKKGICKKDGYLEKIATNFGPIYNDMDSSHIKVLTNTNKNQWLTPKEASGTSKREEEKNIIFKAAFSCKL